MRHTPQRFLIIPHEEFSFLQVKEVGKKSQFKVQTATDFIMASQSYSIHWISRKKKGKNIVFHYLQKFPYDSHMTYEINQSNIYRLTVG